MACHIVGGALTRPSSGSGMSRWSCGGPRRNWVPNRQNLGDLEDVAGHAAGQLPV